jgi:hypothetical protein
MNRYIRLNITTEGPTEHRFVNEVLSKHLQPLHIYCQVRSVLTSKEYKKRGGMTTYARAKRDILQWMRHDHSTEARFTTMFDLYALPNDFPGLLEAQSLVDPYDQVRCIEAALADDLADRRFVPYVQLHEFEALLFANLEVLLLEYEDRQPEVEELKAQLAKPPANHNPELVNGQKETSPSHRISRLIPEYQKVGAGSLLADLIGMDHLRASCRHFNEWVQRLENL